MKVGLFNKQELLNSKGEFIGYNLGYDFATEHESGIQGIRELFGINQVKKNVLERAIDRLTGAKPRFGIKARTATMHPSGMQSTGDGVFSIGFSTRFINYNAFFNDLSTKLAWPGRKECFIACWDSEGIVLTTKNKDHYEALSKAIMEDDVAFYLGGKGFLSSGGLHMVIASKVDQEVDDLMQSLDEDAYELGKKADATNIEKKLIKAGKKFRALSPGWKDETKTEVCFFMNPVDQTKYEAGWYTVEELEQWIDDKGPVLERKKEKLKT